jgi:hypothetical protein
LLISASRWLLVRYFQGLTFWGFLGLVFFFILPPELVSAHIDAQVYYFFTIVQKDDSIMWSLVSVEDF